MSAAQAIGVDVGGTKTAARRVTATGETLDSTVRPTPAEDQEATLSAMEAAVADVMGEGVKAIGVGAAGLVDVRAGVLRFSPNLAWRDVPLAQRLGERFGLPVTVDNDATAAAWAEAQLGASQGYRDSLFVGVGTGIGGGIVVGGQLVRGAHGFAGEIGHIIVEPGGPACGCGNRGCWEQVAGGSAISRAGRTAVTQHPGSRIADLARGDPESATGEVVALAAGQGDIVATEILAQVGRRLGEGVAGLVNILDPEVVVVGGGVAEIGELLLGPLRQAYRATVEGRSIRPDVPIVSATLGNAAGTIGAALLALEATPA